MSATSIMDAIPKSKYAIVPIGVRKDGRFVLYKKSRGIVDSHNVRKVRLAPDGIPITFDFGKQTRVLSFSTKPSSVKLDVVFPVLHGTFGEDGTLQGLLDMANLPYVGPGVLGSAVGMDKDVTKRLWRDAGLPIADFIVLRASQKRPTYIEVVRKLGAPFFIKPAVAGSSVGVHKVESARQFQQALVDAFSYSEKVLIERIIVGKEIECSVLGSDQPEVSLPGAVKPTHSFYSYEAKYLDPNGAQFEIPVHLPKETIRRIQSIVQSAYTTLGLEGMARVDGFLSNQGQFILNEVNTIPGFTKISMYPKLWEVSGLSFPRLIDRLLELAIERHERNKQRKINLS